MSQLKDFLDYTPQTHRILAEIVLYSVGIKLSYSGREASEPGFLTIHDFSVSHVMQLIDLSKMFTPSKSGG